MGIVWNILDSIRKNISENVDIGTAIIGNGDVPASLLPAVKIFPNVVSSNSAAEIPTVFELTATIEILFLPKTEEDEMISKVEKIENILNSDIYPEGCRLKNSPTSRIYRDKNFARTELTIRWCEI